MSIAVKEQLQGGEHEKAKSTTVAGFEPARVTPMDFESIPLTTRAHCLWRLLRPRAHYYMNITHHFDTASEQTIHIHN